MIDTEKISGKQEMAYNWRKITFYGGIGAVIAVSVMLAFLWTAFEEVGIVPIVELESITPGTLAITVISDNSDTKVTQLKITINRLDVKPQNGDWTEVEIPGGTVSFDLLQRQGTFIDAIISQLEPGSMIKMHIMQGYQFTNATINNSDVIDVVLPSETIEFKTPIVIEGRVYIVRSEA
jgi:hypothetical protein